MPFSNYLLASSALCYWKLGQGGRHLLQVTRLYARLQVGPHLQLHSMLATLSSSLLPSMLLHPGHQRCKIIMWTCHQNANGGRPNKFRITSCIILSCSSVSTSLLIYYTYTLLLFNCPELHTSFSFFVLLSQFTSNQTLHKRYHYLASDKGRNICRVVFSETAAFGSYGVKHELKRQLLMRTGLPRVGPLARCILKAQEVTAKGVYRPLHAIYYCR